MHRCAPRHELERNRRSAHPRDPAPRPGAHHSVASLLQPHGAELSPLGADFSIRIAKRSLASQALDRHAVDLIDELERHRFELIH